MAAIVGTIASFPYSEVSFSFIDAQAKHQHELLKKQLRTFEKQVLTDAMAQHYSSEERIRKLLLPDINEAQLPRQLRINDDTYLFDYFDFDYDLKLVSDKFKSIIEHLEPGCHRFSPVDIVNQENAVVAHFFILQIRQVVSAIDSLADPSSDRSPMSNVNRLSQTVVKNLTLWRDVQMRNKVFVSNQARDALVDNNIKNCQVQCVFEER